MTEFNDMTVDTFLIFLVLVHPFVTTYDFSFICNNL